MALFASWPGRQAGSSRAVRCEVDAMTVNAASGATAGTVQNAWNWPAPPDPGDLSRRMAARRAELRLSLSQVAERAAVNRRYRQSLENFPGQPDAGTLCLLAAALRTTPAALLGGGGDAPPGRRPGPVGLGLEPLSLADCHRLLAPGGFGRRLHHRFRADGPAGELRPGVRHHRAADRDRFADRGARRRPSSRSRPTILTRHNCAAGACWSGARRTGCCSPASSGTCAKAATCGPGRPESTTCTSGSCPPASPADASGRNRASGKRRQ